jgi:hypothetical protein
LDVFGHLWAASYNNNTARKFHVDESGFIPNDGAGNPTGIVLDLPTGSNPFSYGDFTGYGRMNYVIHYPPQGSYRRRVTACEAPGVPGWNSVNFTASKPAGTGLQLWVRSADRADDLAGQTWQGPWDTSPVDLQSVLSPNPARFVELDFRLTSPGDATPVLEQFGVTWECQ